MSDPQTKPLLSLEELWPGRVLGPQQLVVDEAVLTAYRAVAGDDHASAPLSDARTPVAQGG